MADAMRLMKGFCAASVLFLTCNLQASLVSSVNSQGQIFGNPITFGCTDTGTANASCDFAQGGVFGSASGSYQANSGYSRLDALSMSSSFAGEASGSAVADFTDTLLLTAGSGSGTLLFIVQYWGFGQSESCNDGCPFNTTIKVNTVTLHAAWGDPREADLPFSFTFGTVFNLNASASAFSSALGHELARQTAHLKLDAIQVFNSDGALVTDFNITSGSGAAYPFVAPEPGTFALAAALVALLAVKINAFRKS